MRRGLGTGDWLDSTGAVPYDDIVVCRGDPYGRPLKVDR